MGTGAAVAVRGCRRLLAHLLLPAPTSLIPPGSPAPAQRLGSAAAATQHRLQGEQNPSTAPVGSGTALSAPLAGGQSPQHLQQSAAHRSLQPIACLSLLIGPLRPAQPLHSPSPCTAPARVGIGQTKPTRAGIGLWGRHGGGSKDTVMNTQRGPALCIPPR